MQASSTVTFIETSKYKIVVDPGINRKLLLQKLKENRLTTKGVDYVFLTHTHIDHCALIGVFENAKFVDGELIYKDDIEFEHEAVIPDTNIKIIESNGHDTLHSCLYVPTKQGTVVVAGDLFWWFDGKQDDSSREKLLGLKDPFGDDIVKLKESRLKVLEAADWIIPGHGRMFKNPKN